MIRTNYVLYGEGGDAGGPAGYGLRLKPSSKGKVEIEMGEEGDIQLCTWAEVEISELVDVLERMSKENG